mgnify:CR=1 FL=1
MNYYNNNHKDDNNNNNNNIVFVRATTISGSATGMSSPGNSGETLNVAAGVAATVVASGTDTKTIKDVGNTIDKTNNNNNNPTNIIKNNNDSGTTKITTRTPSSPTRNSPTSPPSDASNQQAIDITTSSSSSQLSSSSSSSATATDTQSAMVDENISSATGVTLETTKNVTTTPSKVVKKKKRPYIAAIPTEVDDTRMNYAAKSAGAVIIDSSKDFKYKGNILDDVESNYALVPCASKHKYVTISLSEDAQVDGISLKNAEAYSGTLTDVQVLGSAKYPTKQWTLLGEINVENNNNKQSFKLPRPAWINFVKLRFRSHYGDEFYCTLTRVIINGQSMMDAVQKTLDEASFIDEDEDEDGLYNDDDDNKYGNDAAVSTTATTTTTTTTVTATATSDTASSTSTTTASDQNDIDESNNVYTEMNDGSDEERSQVESQDLENADTNAENGNRNLLHDTKGDVIDEHNHLADSNRVNENIDNEVEINANGQVSEASNSENNLEQNENEDFREDSDTLSTNANNADKAASSLTASDSSTDGASSASNGNLRTDNNKRKIPPNHKKYGKPLKGENLEVLDIVEKSTFMKNYIIKRAKAADLNAMERWELMQMRKAEEATKWFLTEEKIWFAGRTICAYSRGHIARNYKRKAYKAIRDIQRVFRGHLGRERVARVRAYRRINAASKLIKSWNMLRIKIARWKLMTVGIHFIVGERWVRRSALFRIKNIIVIHMFQTRMRKRIEDEKLNRAATKIQRLFRNRMMKELMKMIYYKEPSELIFRLFYRGALSGPCLEILSRLLGPFATIIQCRFRQKKARRRVAKRREEYRLWCKKQEERRVREARRKAALEYRERQRRAELLRKERKTKADVLKGLAKCFDDPDWGKINDLVIVGKPLLGKNNQLILKAEKVLRVLEKEWSHFHRTKERSRVKKRADNRKYESIERELDREFVKGNLSIVLPPLPASPKVTTMIIPDEDRENNKSERSSRSET